MKKSLSVLSLAATTSFWRILAILAALAVTQLLTAYWMLCNLYAPPLESILDFPVYRFSPAVAITLATLVLLNAHGGTRSRVNYTMARLSIPSRSLLLIHMVYCVGIYLLFWLFQVSMVIATAALFRFLAPLDAFSVQLELLTCYRSVYLHPLLPLADWPFWITTPLVYLGLGVNTGIGMVRSWEGKVYMPPVVFAVSTALYAAKPGDYGWGICLMFALWGGVCVSYYQYVTAKAREVVT
ncbi:hypothetical protein [Pseudoflavonifractor sp. An85]|uniref:hypothetical protein n=1 Tax=Pseudoflavonifractor sp. An85 TaxID=1965661 RepID=UPI000B38851D|nr:hypothetical protein [Pseudoflavonifractor sp. An85]OUN25441.1 hypothetical protein B5G37_04325 [Pseudoflavonifractor sp. An85]